MALALLGVVSHFLTPSAAGAQVRYLAFGDSITEGTGDDENREEKGYPPRLEDLLEGAGVDAVVENHGVGGERTPEGVTRIDSVLAGGGDVLLLMEGSNDISRSISRETTVFNLGEMARKTEAAGLEAVQATLIPRIPRAREDPENIRNKRLNEEIRHQAGLEDRRLVDNFEVFLRLPALFTTYYWTNPQDFVGHPNAEGYDEMADAFFDVLRDVDSVSPVTGILNPWNGATEVSPNTNITVEIWDFGAGIDTAATTLLVDGVEVTPEVSGGSQRQFLSYDPPQPLSGNVELRLQARDLATPTNSVDRQIASFSIVGAGILEGDFNEDGRVDGADLVRLGIAFGSRAGESRFDAAVDLDDNNLVDGQDLARFASNFGSSL